jgi:1,4-dihydroxy-2-naphthoate octaprenyltransferase
MFKRFLKFVEITTKITSVYAFANTLAFMLVTGKHINVPMMVIFCVAAFIFDLTTTGINNYIDSKDYPEMLPIKRSNAFVAIIGMLAISTIMGLFLAYKTGIVVLLIGALCFLLGIFYTFGPLPISRIPLGEIFSGVAYGMMIPFLMLYINNPTDYIELNINIHSIDMKIMIGAFVSFLLFSVVNTLTTSNIMLANNTCDLKKDIAVGRHTLVFHIGQPAAVKLYAILYYLCYVSVIIMVIASILPPVALIFIVSLPVVQKNINAFKVEQIKEKTFITSIKNFIVINSSYLITLLLSALFLKIA